MARFLLRANALGERQLSGVHLPAGSAELRIDDLARVGLIEIKRRTRFVGLCDDEFELRGPSFGGLGLESREAREHFRLTRGRLVHQRLKSRKLFFSLARPLLSGELVERRLLGRSLRGFGLRLGVAELLLQEFELRVQGSGRIGGRLRRRERPRLEPGIAPEGAVKPDRQLACELQAVQRVGRRPRVLVGREISRLADDMKEIGNLAVDDARIPEPAEKVERRIFRRRVLTGAGGRLLGNGLRELPQPDDAGRRVELKVALRLLAEDGEPFLVRRQKCEVLGPGRQGPEHNRIGSAKSPLLRARKCLESRASSRRFRPGCATR